MHFTPLTTLPQSSPYNLIDASSPSSSSEWQLFYASTVITFQRRQSHCSEGDARADDSLPAHAAIEQQSQQQGRARGVGEKSPTMGWNLPPSAMMQSSTVELFLVFSRLDNTSFQVACFETGCNYAKSMQDYVIVL